VACMSNVKQLGLALQLYVNDFGIYPPGAYRATDGNNTANTAILHPRMTSFSASAQESCSCVRALGIRLILILTKAGQALIMATTPKGRDPHSDWASRNWNQ